LVGTLSLHFSNTPFGVDDGLDLVPSPVPDMGHFNQAYWVAFQVPKASNADM
jgi:hypothetical protein